LLAQCSATKRDGTRCERSADGPHGLCWAHDPANAGERRRMASKAGRSKPSGEIRALKVQLQELADNVLSGRVNRSDAAVVGQVFNVLLRAIEIERKVKETEELEQSVSELRTRLQEIRGTQWGA
jgi:hypothetical protein